MLELNVDLFTFSKGVVMLDAPGIAIPQRPFAKVHDAKIGQRVLWSERFSKQHTHLTALATGDWNPIHFDEEYAAKTRFGRTILHGATLAGRISQKLGMDFPGRGTIWLKSDTTHWAVVYHGDLVEFCAEIIEVFPGKERLVVKTTGTVDGRVVLENTSLVHLTPDPLDHPHL